MLKAKDSISMPFLQHLDMNWKKGHCTLTKINTGSAVVCLRFDTEKIVSGHGDGDDTIKVCS